jgi:3-deoxy-manno-octulosonate cytidylyltransferase (CMP-KDO synthetase)
MSAVRTIAVIPARMASSRFPGKPLVRIAGLPMIEHVRRRTLLCDVFDEVIVATCDEDIRRTVEAAGGRAVMTADTHTRCTTRVAEALGSVDGDVVAIVQGDEPLLIPDVLRAAVAPLHARAEVQCTNVLSPLADDTERRDPDVVKAAADREGNVVFFSRAPLPYPRQPGPSPVYRQTGIMAFRRDCLLAYVALPETPLERVESIDMLRLIEHRWPILGVVVDFPTVGVDRDDDVAIVEAALAGDPVQAALHGRISGAA